MTVSSLARWLGDGLISSVHAAALAVGETVISLTSPLHSY